MRCVRKVKQIRQQMCETTFTIDIKSILANMIYMISTCMTRIWQSETWVRTWPSINSVTSSGRCLA